MSQPVLAEHLGMSVSKLKRIEAGKQLPNFERKGVALVLVEAAEASPADFSDELGSLLSERDASGPAQEMRDLKAEQVEQAARLLRIERLLEAQRKQPQLSARQRRAGD
jgi:transcriptional regulator with XRE-family HTH domain